MRINPLIANAAELTFDGYISSDTNYKELMDGVYNTGLESDSAYYTSITGSFTLTIDAKANFFFEKLTIYGEDFSHLGIKVCPYYNGNTLANITKSAASVVGEIPEYEVEYQDSFPQIIDIGTYSNYYVSVDRLGNIYYKDKLISATSWYWIQSVPITPTKLKRVGTELFLLGGVGVHGGRIYQCSINEVGLPQFNELEGLTLEAQSADCWNFHDITYSTYSNLYYAVGQKSSETFESQLLFSSINAFPGSGWQSFSIGGEGDSYAVLSIECFYDRLFMGEAYIDSSALSVLEYNISTDTLSRHTLGSMLDYDYFRVHDIAYIDGKLYIYATGGYDSGNWGDEYGDSGNLCYTNIDEWDRIDLFSGDEYVGGKLTTRGDYNIMSLVTRNYNLLGTTECVVYVSEDLGENWADVEVNMDLPTPTTHINYWHRPANFMDDPIKITYSQNNYDWYDLDFSINSTYIETDSGTGRYFKIEGIFDEAKIYELDLQVQPGFTAFVDERTPMGLIDDATEVDIMITGETEYDHTTFSIDPRLNPEYIHFISLKEKSQVGYNNALRFSVFSYGDGYLDVYFIDEEPTELWSGYIVPNYLQPYIKFRISSMTLLPFPAPRPEPFNLSIDPEPQPSPYVGPYSGPYPYPEPGPHPGPHPIPYPCVDKNAYRIYFIPTHLNAVDCFPQLDPTINTDLDSSLYPDLDPFVNPSLSPHLAPGLSPNTRSEYVQFINYGPFYYPDPYSTPDNREIYPGPYVDPHCPNFNCGLFIPEVELPTGTWGEVTFKVLPNLGITPRSTQLNVKYNPYIITTFSGEHE